MSGTSGRPTRGVYADAVDNVTQQERMDMGSSLPAQIVDFNGTTATLKVLYKPVYNGKEIEFPDLLEVPVDQPRAAGFAMTFPIKKGDTGIVSFMARDQDEFISDGSAKPPATARLNSFSDGRFVPGANPGSKAMSNYDRDNLFIGTDDHKNGVRVTGSGTLSIESNGESLMAILDELLATLVQEDLVIAYGSSAGSGHALHFRAKYGELRGRLGKMKFR